MIFSLLVRGRMGKGQRDDCMFLLCGYAYFLTPPRELSVCLHTVVFTPLSDGNVNLFFAES